MTKAPSAQKMRELRAMADASAEAMMEVVKASRARHARRLEARSRK